MPVASEDKRTYNALFVDFVYLLREYEVPVSMKDLLELNAGFEKGLVDTIDDLFVFMRLSFVRRVEHMDAFERAFALYFYDIDIPPVAEGDLALLRTKAFRDWLNRAIEEGELPARAKWDMTPEELMKKFWDRLRSRRRSITAVRNGSAPRAIRLSGIRETPRTGFVSAGPRAMARRLR